MAGVEKKGSCSVVAAVQSTLMLMLALLMEKEEEKCAARFQLTNTQTIQWKYAQQSNKQTDAQDHAFI